MKKRKPIPTTLADWIERNVILPDTGATPGPMKLWPWQREIADAITDPAIERVSLLKASRIGFSALLTAAIGYFATARPSPILYLLPTEADCRGFIVDDVEPMFEATPVLRKVLKPPAVARQDRNTMLHRIFKGGSLKCVAGKAPRNMRRHTARILMIDEVDAIEVSAEGDPCALAERRTLTFDDRKIIIGGTPIDAATSHAARSYSESDKRVYECPCPACGAFTEIMWSHIVYPAGQPELAAFRCPHCEAIIAEQHKPAMVKAGHWRITAPHVKGHAGFRLSALVSLLANASWAKLAAEYERVKDDPVRLKAFWNTLLGLAWEGDGDEIDDDALRHRAEVFSLEAIPREVLAITVGCDVQGDRLEATVTGWGRDGACFVLGHEVLWGTPGEADSEVWRDLDGLLRQRWPHPTGGSLGVDVAAVDAGDGGVMDIVQAFCAPRFGKRVFAIKGAPGFHRTFIARAKISGKPLFIVGVDAIKARLFDRIGNARAVRFSNTLPDEWYEQLTSERRIVKLVRGKPVTRFERKPGFAAEGLDCLVYAHAARAALTLNFDLRQDQLALQAPVMQRPTVYRSEWMSR